MKAKKTLKITVLIIFAVVTCSLIRVYNRESREELNRTVSEEVARKERLMKYFKGQKFTYKSSGISNKRFQCYGDEHSDGSKCVKDGQGKHVFGTIEQAAMWPSRHVFDFVNMTVTLNAHFDKTSKKTTYLISDYVKKVSHNSLTHILKIGSAGMNEIRIDPDAGTIAYHYAGGKVLVFKDLTRVASFELLEANSKLGFLH